MINLVDIAHAAAPDPTPAVAAVINPIIKNIVSPLIMLMFAVTIVVFVWGIVEMFLKGDDPTAREKGRTHMLAGIIGVFIMVSAWGIIQLISNTL
jgi:hypothetical protein